MKYIMGTNFKLQNTAISLGKFDGLHIGHKTLINYVNSMKNKGFTSVVFSFALHPYNLFSDKEIKLIHTEVEKRIHLENMELDAMVSYPFTEDTASMRAKEFIKEILVDKMDAKIIAVGSDFRFGFNREGDVSLLKELAAQYGYELKVFEKVTFQDEIVSSSRIREEIEKANMELVTTLLGQPYSIIGTVLHGRKLGRTIGMPTTNLIPDKDKLLPPNGVYASKTIIDGKEYPGITNIGNKPTVGAEKEVGVETFIFDFDDDLYGRQIQVDIYKFKRNEQVFGSLEELKKQMNHDIAFAKAYFHI